MKKAFRFIKGIIKGVRDAAPIPSHEAETETEKRSMSNNDDIWQLIGQKISSRSIMFAVMVYLLDQLFKIGIFS